MRYLKIYENYFLEKDKVKETSKKLDNDFEQEIQLFSECFDTQDFIEGTTAFVEKRKANFKGE